ncbi:MAG: potassium transporter TrkG [Thermodesulfobacteriota bacterium]
MATRWLTPYSLPILSFALVIATGAGILHHPASLVQGQISWVDALFTATSATCVTGLVVVDTGTFYTRFGQDVILGLIQLGGLGVMTYTSLVLYLWRRKVSVTDRVAVGQSLLHDPSFALGRFLVQAVSAVLAIELAGAAGLYLATGGSIGAYSAVFHAVSAFCNAGFSLYTDNLVAWKGHWGVNLVVMALIVPGGLGFSVLLEVFAAGTGRRRTLPGQPLFTWHTHIVLKTSGLLVLGGALFIFAAEYLMQPNVAPAHEEVLTSLFQSVTCRTAGFNTVDIGKMTNVSLLVMMFLMFVGGSPGSCAGGIKTTTLRALTAFAASQLRGRRQAVAGRFALDHETMNKSLTLTMFALFIVLGATMLLSVTEVGLSEHDASRGSFIELLFEVISAFGTVGLSTGITSTLSDAGKIVITLVMFIGRLGPIIFLQVLQDVQRRENFLWPENSLMVG